jgi:hypothetical protein
MAVADAVLAGPPRTCVACGAMCTTPFCVACGADEGGFHLPLCAASPEVERLTGRLNVGACGAAGLWTFSHGAPVLGVLYWIGFVLPPVPLGIMVYLLFNGNRVALQRRRFASPEEFLRVQRAWAPFGWLVLVVVFLPLLVFALILIVSSLVPDVHA